MPFYVNEFFHVCNHPRWVSADNHNINVFLELVKRYSLFMIVDGLSVSSKYAQRSIRVLDGSQRLYSFPCCSSGLMGEDVDDCWISDFSMYRRLLKEGTEWKDLHATRPRTNSIKGTRRLESLIIFFHFSLIAGHKSPLRRLMRVIKKWLSSNL